MICVKPGLTRQSGPTACPRSHHWAWTRARTPTASCPTPATKKTLAERTLTKLYNQRPAWLNSAHKALDTAVAQAYGWSDYTAAMPDEDILKRLPALNLERSGS